jgi:hypothetical protein
MFHNVVFNCLCAVVVCMLSLSSSSAVAATTCDISYTYGSGENAFNLCFSNHGNLVSFESPAGAEHIDVGTIGEGYAVCSGTQVYAYDAGFDEAGWGPATVKQPTNGQTFPITVTRTTTDGTFQLVQVIAINANQASQSPEREVTMQMKLTNLSASTVNNLYLTRYVDFDVDGTSDDDIFSVSRDTVLGHSGAQQSPGVWIDAPGGHGVMLTGLNFALPKVVEINPAADWATNHNMCTTGTGVTGPTNLPAGDFAGRVAIKVGNMPSGSSKTINFVYRRF